MKTGILAEPVLVGRERELEKLDSLLDSAINGKGKTVFVSGEAGSGKTRLTTEFLTRAKKRGVTALSGWCLSNATVPYFPFFEAFNSYFTGENETVKQEELEVTAWLMGPSQAEKVGKPQAISPQVWKDQTFVAVAKTLSAISFGKPVVLFIDDIHWADSASLALIHYIARATRSGKILLVATYRSEELTANIEGRPHPLVETLRLMKREDLVNEIEVVSLDQRGVSQLARNMLGAELQTEFAEKLSEESQGNPLFVVESLRMLHERGGLLEEDDKWHLAGGQLEIPDKIKDIILQRLSCLLRNDRKIIDAASVIGEKFDAELLASVVGLDFTEVAEALELIGQTTSLLACEAGLYRFDHARTRDTVYGAISPVLKRVYHRKVAEQLETMTKNGKLPLGEVAYHYAQAEDKEKAVRYSLAAGQDSLTRCSNVEAIKHFSYVLQVADASLGAEAKMTALEGLADAYYANSMFEKAIETYEELATSAEGSIQLRAYRKQMEAIFYKEFDPARLLELVNKVEKIAASDRLENARVRWNRGRAFLYSRDPRALEEHEEALRVFEEEYSLYDIANLLVGTGSTRLTLQIYVSHNIADAELVKGFGEVLLGTAMVHELGDERLEATFITLGIADYFNGWGFYQEALNSYTKALQISERICDFSNMAFALLRIRELQSYLTENWAEGMPQLLKALEYSKKTDSKFTQSQVLAGLVMGYVFLGDLKQAEEYYSELKKMRMEIVSNLNVWTRILLAESVLHAAKRQWKEASEFFEKYLDSIGEFIYSAGYQIGFRKIYAWALNGQGRTEEAQAQLTKAETLTEQLKEIFAHASIYANFTARREVAAGQELEMRVGMVNVSRKPSVVVRIEGLIPAEFEVVNLPSFCSLQNGSIDMKRKSIDPFDVEIIKLKLRTSKAGSYSFSPSIAYVDDLGETKTLKLDPVTVTVQPVQQAFEVLPGRIATGYTELDRLLLGGIPEKYAVVLASPATDERELLTSKFLEAGATAGEITFYVTREVGNAKLLAEKHPENFFLFVCNPQDETTAQNLPNVFKLNGVENLTDIDIALTKAFRVLDASLSGHRRFCIEVISDVLLQHHAVITRRWLSALLPTLKAKGFTIFAVIDSTIHPPEETRAVTGIFDGEIMVTEKGDRQVLKIRKLHNQKYLEEEISLTKEDLST